MLALLQSQNKIIIWHTFLALPIFLCLHYNNSTVLYTAGKKEQHLVVPKIHNNGDMNEKCYVKAPITIKYVLFNPSDYFYIVTKNLLSLRDFFPLQFVRHTHRHTFHRTKQKKRKCKRKKNRNRIHRHINLYWAR